MMIICMYVYVVCMVDVGDIAKSKSVKQKYRHCMGNIEIYYSIDC